MIRVAIEASSKIGDARRRIIAAHPLQVIVIALVDRTNEVRLAFFAPAQEPARTEYLAAEIGDAFSIDALITGEAEMSPEKLDCAIGIARM
jgi:hypothetical protein